ncbi:MAG: hypothetical protein MJ188_04905 [Treponema sp.]|nr:hypothetical protein [Treponema sp.]
MKKIAFILGALLMIGGTSFAQSWTYSLTTDFAYYPQSDFVASSAAPGSKSSHFAPLTGAYSGIELRTTGFADYTIPTPLGEHWLVSDASIVLEPALELTPVSLRPMFSASFTPLPFLIFSAGSSFGLGWNVLGFEGLCYLDTPTSNYKPLKTFNNFYYDFWAQATFQFDTGAIIPGDWSHVVMLASYQICYSALTNVANGQIYEWQASVNKANGLKYYSSIILAYQMPLVLYRAGAMVDLEGHYNSSDYGKLGNNFQGNFQSVAISPFLQLNLGTKNELYFLAGFSNRRSFTTSHNSECDEPYLIANGTEWFFNRFALSWTHYF